MSKLSIDLSIVLPTYQERDNLEILIPKVEERFKDTSLEIIIVDDGSKDGTDELVTELSKKFSNIVFIKRPSLQGIGSALREGYNTASGNFILSSDADLSFLPEDMFRLYEKVKERYDIVLGYKVKYRPIEKKSGFLRVLAAAIKYSVSIIGNFLVRNLSGLREIKNFNTNFRIIRRTVWKNLETVEKDHFFLFETIFKAAREEIRITEIPVTFFDRKFGDSKLNFFLEAPKYFWKLVKYTLFS